MLPLRSCVFLFAVFVFLSWPDLGQLSHARFLLFLDFLLLLSVFFCCRSCFLSFPFFWINFWLLCCRCCLCSLWLLLSLLSLFLLFLLLLVLLVLLSWLLFVASLCCCCLCYYYCSCLLLLCVVVAALALVVFVVFTHLSAANSLKKRTQASGVFSFGAKRQS